MDEYQLLFSSIPVIKFAHRYDTEKYRIAAGPVECGIEITYVLRGDCDIQYPENKETVHVPCDSVFLTVYDRSVVFTSDTYHQHATIYINTKYTYAPNGGLVLPHVLSFGTPENSVRSLMEKIILHYNLEPDAPLNQSMVWELLGKISSMYLEEKEKSQSPGQSVYVRRAQKYIHEHLSEPLRLTDIAASLSISPGYLSHLFSEIQGQTLMEYVNTLRVQRVEELVLKYGLEIREAGMRVGLNDPDYISRLFRKVRGCSLTELRRVREKRENKK